MKPWLKNYKFDIEIKDKGYTGVMNVHDTFFLNDTPMYLMPMSKQKEATVWTEICRQTDTRTDGETGWFLYTFCTSFAGGFKSRWLAIANAPKMTVNVHVGEKFELEILILTVSN